MPMNKSLFSTELEDDAKSQHTVIGIRTWHVNLNPRAMPSLGFAKGFLPAPSKTQSDLSGNTVHVDWRGPFATQAGALIVEITTDKGLEGFT